MPMRGSCKAHEEKQRKKFVGQQLGVTPRSWLTPKRWLLIWNCVDNQMGKQTIIVKIFFFQN